MSWLRQYRKMWDAGVLGMNRRNTEYILDHNPRALFPRVDGKRRMHDLCRQIGVPVPEIYAGISRHSGLRHLELLLAGHEDFVIKPNRGAAGRGIMVIVGRDGDGFVRHDGRRVEMAEVRQQVSSIISGLFSLGGQSDEALIQRRVVPDPAFERVSYQGIGDVRVLVYEHVPVMAMLRLPTRLSSGRANLHQGGIGAGVDLETGVTSRAVMRNHLTDRHPDTGEPLVGLRVPCWQEILEMSVKVSRAVGLGYIGVDVVLDRQDGPLLLEANARPGLAIQIANGKGLLPLLAAVDRRPRTKGEVP